MSTFKMPVCPQFEQVSRTLQRIHLVQLTVTALLLQDRLQRVRQLLDACTVAPVIVMVTGRNNGTSLLAKHIVIISAEGQAHHTEKAGP